MDGSFQIYCACTCGCVHGEKTEVYEMAKNAKALLINKITSQGGRERYFMGLTGEAWLSVMAESLFSEDAAHCYLPSPPFPFLP